MADSIERYFFGKDRSPEPIVVLNSVLNAPPMVISIIGNILLLVAVLRTPSIRSPSTILLCSLALSDLLVGVVVQSLYLAAFLKKKSFFAKRIKNIVFYCKWCFFIHYDSHSSGSVLSPSLSHAIRSVNDYMSRKVFPNGPLDRCRLVIKLRFPK